MNHLKPHCAVPGSETAEIFVCVCVCVCVCVSAILTMSQCFNKLTRGATEAAKVELLSPELACHRWKDRNTGGMAKPQESLYCLYVLCCVWERIFPSPISSSAFSPLEETFFNQWWRERERERERERHFTLLPIRSHHNGGKSFFTNDVWSLLSCISRNEQRKHWKLSFFFPPKLLTSVEGNLGLVYLNCSLGVKKLLCNDEYECSATVKVLILVAKSSVCNDRN